ncbi:hypothetical protein [Thermococcus sp.]|uniref:hypothetical protein n=1 Tax=Thermococcus sp. TaxID=35749 RepID=UPI00261C23EA|nr:hypothetical protein [Thermococcus sp.]
MRKIFDTKGVFYTFNESRVKIRENDELVRREEKPTELWWKLKEAVKGKKVRVVVYEVEE